MSTTLAVSTAPAAKSPTSSIWPPPPKSKPIRVGLRLTEDLAFGECRTRTHFPIARCSEYHPFRDQCTACENDSLSLSSSGLECLPISSGCLDGSGDCTRCSSDFFLSLGQCTRPIPNCRRYADSAPARCLECEPPFDLDPAQVPANYRPAAARPFTRSTPTPPAAPRISTPANPKTLGTRPAANVRQAFSRRCNSTSASRVQSQGVSSTSTTWTGATATRVTLSGPSAKSANRVSSDPIVKKKRSAGPRTSLRSRRDSAPAARNVWTGPPGHWSTSRQMPSPVPPAPKVPPLILRVCIHEALASAKLLRKASGSERLFRNSLLPNPLYFGQFELQV